MAHPAELMTTSSKRIVVEMVYEPIELMQDLFEPELIHLMDDDEKHLVMLFGFATRVLQLQQPLDLQVLAIRRHDDRS